jgi:hypothetical protein
LRDENAIPNVRLKSVGSDLAIVRYTAGLLPQKRISRVKNAGVRACASNALLSQPLQTIESGYRRWRSRSTFV